MGEPVDSDLDPQEAEPLSQAESTSDDQGDKQKADDKPNSQAVTQADLDKFRAELTEELRRESQSEKDRRFSKLEKGQQTLLDLVTGKMEAGMTKEQAMREAKLDLLIADDPPDQSKEPKSVTSEVTGEAARVRASQLLKEAGITGEAADGILDKVNRHTAFSSEAAIDRLVVVELGKLATKPAASPAQAAQLGSTSKASKADGDELLRAYNEAKTKIRQGDVNALVSLKQEFQQKGLDIF